jgi:predicted dehydrogenase
MGSSLAKALLATGEATLAVVHDLNTQAASGLASRCAAEGASLAQVALSAEDLLSYPELDGVIIAVPPYLHPATVCQAAAAGLNIFCEKPMATTVGSCRKMLSAVAHYDVKFMVGHVLRYYEPYRSIRVWAAEGRLGRPFAASIWRMTNGARWTTMPGNWRTLRAQSGGYLLEVGAHELDMLRCLMGHPETVYATEQKVLPYPHEIEDHIAVQIRFEEGGSALYQGGGGSSVPRYGFRLFFEGATLISESAFDPHALQIYDREGKEYETLCREFDAHLSHAEHPVQAELRAWMAALRDSAPIPISGEEGLATVALAQAAYQSAETGQVVVYSLGNE